MRNMLFDKFSVGAGLVGVVLAIATLATGVNAVECSVISPFLRQTTAGSVILIVLLVISFPVLVAAGLTLGALSNLGLSMPVILQCPYMVIFHGLVYLGLAKLVLICVRRIRRV